jgi:hypothetical protein
MIPRTVFGKVVASISAVCGIMVIAFPIEAISRNLNAYELMERRRKKALKLLEKNQFLL